MNKVIGIYKITSPNGCIYIGQSRDCKKREEHYRNNRVKNQPRISNSINKHGWESHKFEVIHECSEYFLNELEKFYIIFYDTFQTKHGMNLSEGGYEGYPSEETRRKISLATKGKKVSEAQRLNMSISKKGKPNFKLRGRKASLEARSNLRASHIGKKLTENQKLKISIALKGKKQIISDEERLRRKLRATGVVFSEERRRKISEAHKGRPRLYCLLPINDDVKKKISESLKNHPNRGFMNSQISLSKIGKPLSEETKAKLKHINSIKYADIRKHKEIKKSIITIGKSGYRGVVFRNHSNSYVVKISISNDGKVKQIHGGYYKDIIQAAKKYNELALKYHGKKAKLNKFDN